MLCKYCIHSKISFVFWNFLKSLCSFFFSEYFWSKLGSIHGWGAHVYRAPIVYVEARWLEQLMCKMWVKEYRVAFKIQLRLVSMNLDCNHFKCFVVTFFPQKYLQLQSQDFFFFNLHLSPPNMSWKLQNLAEKQMENGIMWGKDKEC